MPIEVAADILLDWMDLEIADAVSNELVSGESVLAGTEGWEGCRREQ